MRLTVEIADDGALVARLADFKPELLPADRAADYFYDAVLTALGGHGPDAEPGADEARSEATAPTPSPEPTRPADPAAVQREALRRLDAGEDAAVIAHDLGVSPAQVRRWDDDPSIDAYHDELAEVMLP